MSRVAGLVIGAIAIASSAGAQAIGAGLGAAYALREVQQPSTERRDGMAGEARLLVRLGRAELDFRYLQGRLGRQGTTSLDLVEGQVALNIFLLPWTYLGVGPRVRSYAAGGPAERWVAWQGHAGLSAALLGPAARGYLQLSRTFAGSVNLPASFDPGQGFEAGLVAHLPPLWARLGYRLDHGGAGGGARIDTVELFVLTLGIGDPGCFCRRP